MKFVVTKIGDQDYARFQNDMRLCSTGIQRVFQCTPQQGDLLYVDTRKRPNYKCLHLRKPKCCSFWLYQADSPTENAFLDDVDDLLNRLFPGKERANIWVRYQARRKK